MRKLQTILATMRIHWSKLLAWVLAAMILTGQSRVLAFTSADANRAFAAYTKAFYFTQGTNGYFRATTAGGKADFWKWAEQMEMLMDVYERTTNASCLTVFSNTFNGFTTEHGREWLSNPYNDDIMWIVIASARGYLHTANPVYRDVAQANFDKCFARAWSTNLGGGLWWTKTNSSKNACVNGPAAIAAHLLFQITAETNYLAKSKKIFEWERATLFNTNSGAVADAISADGKIHGWASTYNQGTFIGAANLLGRTNEARLASDFTMNQLCHAGILPQYQQAGDLGGFNGICVRWLAKFMNDRGLQSRYEPWLRQNSEAAWNARRKSDDLIWSRWPVPTPPDQTLYSWACTSAVVLLHAIAPTQE